MASLTENTELHKMKESEKELLEKHAKTLSGVKQVTVVKSTKMETERDFRNIREVLGTLLRNKKKWATDTCSNIHGSQNTLCSVKEAWHTKKLR